MQLSTFHTPLTIHVEVFSLYVQLCIAYGMSDFCHSVKYHARSMDIIKIELAACKYSTPNTLTCNGGVSKAAYHEQPNDRKRKLEIPNHLCLKQILQSVSILN